MNKVIRLEDKRMLEIGVLVDDVLHLANFPPHNEARYLAPTERRTLDNVDFELICFNASREYNFPPIKPANVQKVADALHRAGVKFNSIAPF